MEKRQLPAWSQSLKKWMDVNGAMTNLQREFIFHIEDSLVQPLKKAALESKITKDVSEFKCKKLLNLTEELAEENAQLTLKIEKLSKNVVI